MPAHDPAPFAPFAGIFAADGSLSAAAVGRRLPALVDLLRHHESCFELRLDFDDLARALVGPAGAGLRDAAGEEAFEEALRRFSGDHLHELVDEDRCIAAGRVLQAIADDEHESRKRRGAAAAGVALVGGLPDDRGLRGRGLFDLVLRIGLEELHAQQGLRRRAQEGEGLGAEELEAFWKTYPALRHHYEQRYRRDVEQVLEAIQADRLPLVVSVDLGLRGAHRLLCAVAEHRADGGIDAETAGALLGETFEDDLMDGGRELVVARWAAARATAARSKDPEARARVAACEQALRIVAPGSPGGEMVLFHAYVRAVTEGNFHVQDAAEGQAARAVFDDDGLSADGVLAFARHLVARGDHDSARRVLVAAVELWPDHADVRDEVVAAVEAEEAAARKVALGPRYAEVGETFAEETFADETSADA